MEEGVAIESKMVSKRIESAQKSVEGRNFETRKYVLQYDDVMNKQRETIYTLRRQLMEATDQREFIIGETGVAKDLMRDLVEQYIGSEMSTNDWDIDNFNIQIKDIYAFDPQAEGIDFTQSPTEIEEQIWKHLKANYEEKEKIAGEETLRTIERFIMLEIIDAQWKDHLLSIDHLRQGIGLVGYGQKDPLVEYKKISFDMFQAMLDRIDTLTIKQLFHMQFMTEQQREELERQQQIIEQRRRRRRGALMFTGANQNATAAGEEAEKAKPMVRTSPKFKPNDLCPMGKGKKFKKCCGAEGHDSCVLMSQGQSV